MRPFIYLSHFKSHYLLAALLSASLWHCTTEPSENENPKFEAQGILTDVSEKVIAATYRELALRGEKVLKSLQALKDSTDADHLKKAQAAWRAARQPWEQSEAFLFGPVENEGIDPSIDSWPLDKTTLDGVLAGTAILNRATVDGFEGTQKGFHTLEYLLFGENANKSVEAMTARELEYLVAVGESFNAAVQQLDSAWDKSRGNFVSRFIEAGAANSLYPSETAALQELVGGMVAICDEVANGKIADPFSQKDLNLEESHFSDNSIQDFSDNLRSVENVYRGYTSFTGDSTGQGIQAMVHHFNSELAEDVAAEIQNAIQAIEAVTPSFSKAVFDQPAKVESAQAAVRSLQELLESKVQPLLSNP